MEENTKEDMEKAILAIASMISRSEKAQGKFAPGTSQHTLQKNRIKALYIASALITKKLGGNDAVHCFAEEELEEMRRPIASLISKSEKAQKKLAPSTWQHKMLEDNLKALYIALSCLDANIVGKSE